MSLENLHDRTICIELYIHVACLENICNKFREEERVRITSTRVIKWNSQQKHENMKSSLQNGNLPVKILTEESWIFIKEMKECP